MDLVFISFLKFSVHCASACSCFGQCIVGKVFININALFTLNSGVGIEYVLALQYFSEHGVQSAKHTRREDISAGVVLFHPVNK